MGWPSSTFPEPEFFLSPLLSAPLMFHKTLALQDFLVTDSL